jgi:hypothetical protein
MKKTTFSKFLRWNTISASNTIFLLCCFVLFLGQSISAQTTLINPAAEGGFENGATFAANGWTAVDATPNTWTVGNVPGWFTGTGGAYVSNDTGTTWAYTNNVISRSAFYRDVTFPAGATAVTLNFDWRANGNDTNWDNLLVYVMDTSITPTTAGPTDTNTTTTGWTGYTNGTTGYYLLQRNGTTVPTTTSAVTYSFTAAQLAYVSGATKRLVFVWKNDASGGANPPASVDNISLTATVPSCFAPTALASGNVTTTTAVINWAEPTSLPSVGYEYEVRTSGAAGSGASGLFSSGTLNVGTVSANLSGLSASTEYTYYIRSSCGAGDFSSWVLTAFTTLCDPPTITSTTPASICGQGSATLAATASAGDIKWYAAATGGTALATGATFNTPTITNTTSFWAEASVAGSTQASGKLAPPATATGTTLLNWGVVFNATASVNLQSVSLYSTTAGTVNIKITNSALTEIFATGDVAIAAGGTTTPNIIPLNFTVPVGTGYRILVKAFTGVNLIRDSSTLAFPYNGTDGVINVTSSEWGGTTTSTYYYFYDLKYSSLCASPRTEVVATVATAPAFALSTNATSICPAQSTTAVTITDGATSYDTFVWSPATNITGDAANGWIFNPSATTTYTLTASQSSGALCTSTANVTVTVNPNPVIAASASSNEVCEGTSVTLNGVNNITAAIGTATTLTVQTEQPTAFCNRWDQYWNQTVFTAAELQAAGLSAGNINSIAYTITTLGSGTNVTNFSVSIGTTANTTTTAFVTTGLTAVYGPSTYAHAIGVNTITFSTPYLWDGVSNIILDIRQDGADSTNNAITTYTATQDNMTISATTGTDSAVNTLQALVASASVTPVASVRRLNVVFGGQSTSGLNWSWNPGALTGSSVAVTPTETTTYTLTGTNTVTGCSAEAIVNVTVNLASAPTGNSVQTFEVFNSSEATVANLIATGNNIIWYATEADALADVNPLPATTELVNGEDYFAMQTTTEGCTSVAPLAVTVTVTLGNASFDLNGLKYYPNPVTNVLNVEYTGTITGVEVFNMLGQKIASKNVNEISTTIDMSNLASGSYFIKVKAENGSRTIKVLKN